MIEYYSIVNHPTNKQGLLSILQNTKADEVVILSELEWEVPNITSEIVNEFKNKNVKLTVVLGSYDTLNCEANIIYWPTFWINWTRENLKWVKVSDFDINLVKYPFISLNNRSHYHRCVFIDEMAKNNLIDKGIVTWVKHLNENSNFPYNHFDNRQLLLNDDFKQKLDSFLIPIEYNQSLFHVITEATHKSLFITEKTIIPTLLKKPYIVLGKEGFNRKLLDLGFKLYDEIFDYSFDSEPDIFKRTEMFVKNVEKLPKLDLQETYRILVPKIMYNYNRANEIANDHSFIPDIIKQCVKENDMTDSVYGRYHGFLNA